MRDGSDSVGDLSPQVTTDGAGNWVAVWQSDEDLGGTIGPDWDILVARSTDNGATWTAPAALNTNAAIDSASEGGAQVTTDGAGNWVAVWQSDEDMEGAIGADWDILVARSTDSGATWTAPTALNTNATTDSGNDLRAQVTTDGAGNWVAAWHSWDDLGGTIGTDDDLLVSRSTDNGVTWTAPAPLNTNAATDSRGDGFPQVTTDGEGNWVAVWFSFENPGGVWADEYIQAARSTDNGATWTDPAALTTNATTDSAWWDQNPQLATDGAGNWVAVWFTEDRLNRTISDDHDILMARSTDSGATWTAVAPLNTNAVPDRGNDYVPQVTTDGAGNWVAVWYSYEKPGGGISEDHDLLVARSTDNGATWTDPANLNTNAATDSGIDQYPQMATDGAGNWVVVWQSNESLDGTIGTDWDLLVARSTDNGATWTAPAPLNTNAATDSGR